MISQPSDFRTVGWAFGMTDAALAISMLESAGIYVLPHSHHHASVALHHVTALGGIELRVPASTADDAIALLSEVRFSNARSKRWLVVLAGLMVLFWVGIPAPPAGLFVKRPVIVGSRSD